MCKYKYETRGLFIALISYPFNMDGKDLFDNVFSDFFKKHVEYLTELSTNGLDDELYKPAGYRLVGGQGLAVLSLIDDYAFASRIFNQAHFDELNYGVYEKVSKCKAVVLTGSSEIEEEDFNSSLQHVSKNTFSNEAYPFIGILRLKVDSNLLLGQGLDLIRAIKRRMPNLI